MYARNTLLFSNREPSGKNDGKKDFNVPMGCYGTADICELVGKYLLYQIDNVVSNENIGLYRDKGLEIHRNVCLVQN